MSTAGWFHSAITTGANWRVDLQQVRSMVVEAELIDAAGHRYQSAHGAAIAAAGVVIYTRTGRRPAPGVMDPWVQLRRCAPELGEWADFFAAIAVRHRLLAMGRVKVSTREADDLVRDADRFCHEVERRMARDSDRGAGNWPGGPS